MVFHGVDVRKQFKRMRELAPEAYRAFLEFDGKAFAERAMPVKTKELIALGIARSPSARGASTRTRRGPPRRAPRTRRSPRRPSSPWRWRRAQPGATAASLSSRSTSTTRPASDAPLPPPGADAAGGSGRYRGGEPQAARARGHDAAGGARHLRPPAARAPRRAPLRKHRARRNGPRRRAGDPDAGRHPGRALAGERALGAVRARAPADEGSLRARLLLRSDPRGGGHGPDAERSSLLPRSPEEPLPDSGEVPRRGPPALRTHARARVHHEGRVLVPRRRRRRAARVPEHVRHLRAHLRALRAQLPSRRGGHRGHRRLAVARVPGAGLL